MLFGGEFRIIENLLEQARRRRHAFDTQLAEGATHTGDRSRAVLRGDDELAHQ